MTTPNTYARVEGTLDPVLADLRDCETVLVSGNPIADDPNTHELRCKITITGPTRLLAPLMDALTANAASEGRP